MRSIGFPELLVMFPVGFVLVCCFFALPLWAFWKFYRALQRVTEELAGIREVLTHRAPGNPL